ncbi:Uncharacterised protein [Mycobacteroides abscessus]|nr:Uncharacterised protein [Mycobacteroides abscessus]
MSSSRRSMPESADSTAYGTTISSSRSRPLGTASSDSAASNCHTPLRFCHASRVSWGRGYSGSGFVGSKSSAHGVWIRNSEPLVTGRLSGPTFSPPTVRPPSPS